MLYILYIVWWTLFPWSWILDGVKGEAEWYSHNRRGDPGIFYSVHETNGSVTETPFRFHGINWFGMEGPSKCLEGLQVRSLSSHLHAISFEEGFNFLRLPLALGSILDGSYDTLLSPWYCPECQGKSPFQVLDLIFEWCDQQVYPLKILLDMHRLENYRTDPVWSSRHYPEAEVFRGWKILLLRYASSSSLVGVDLYNEPHDPATFGNGQVSTDWKLYAQRWVRVIFPFLTERGLPRPLVFVNGLKWGQDMRDFSWNSTNDWWTEEERRKVVLSPHSYGPTLTPVKELSTAYLYYRWNLYYGYLSSNWSLVVGEWGGNQDNPEDVVWMEIYVDYLCSHRDTIHGHAFWAWNPTSKDVKGYLENDWYTPVPIKKEIVLKLKRCGY